MTVYKIEPPEHGYSIADTAEKQAWRELIAAVRERIAGEGLEDAVLFHGTSDYALNSIITEGMEAIACFHALPHEEREGDERGTFWGTIDTAAAYADDTAAERHPGSRPVIIAIPASSLDCHGRIVSDGATVDGPLKGLTLLDDPDVAAYWSDFDMDRPWREALRDLGAVVSIHRHDIAFEDLTVVRSMEDFEQVFAEARSALLPQAEPARPIGV